MKVAYKIIILVPVVCAMLISLVFIGIGAYAMGVGFYSIFFEGLKSEATPGIVLLKSLDVFLIAFIFLIFAIGFTQLFFPKPSRFHTIMDQITPDWLQVKSFTELKIVLWDTVLTSLVVIFVADAFTKHKEAYSWEFVLLPAAILCIALSRFLLKGSMKH